MPWLDLGGDMVIFKVFSCENEKMLGIFIIYVPRLIHYHQNSLDLKIRVRF